MPATAATLFGTAGVTFGFPNEEGGFLIEKMEVSETRAVKGEVRDTQGNMKAKAYADKTINISIDGVPSSATGIGAAAVASSLTVANYTPSAGLIIVEEITTSSSNTDYKKQSIKAVCHPSITS